MAIQGIGVTLTLCDTVQLALYICYVCSSTPTTERGRRPQLSPRRTRCCGSCRRSTAARPPRPPPAASMAPTAAASSAHTLEAVYQPFTTTTHPETRGLCPLTGKSPSCSDLCTLGNNHSSKGAPTLFCIAPSSRGSCAMFQRGSKRGFGFSGFSVQKPPAGSRLGRAWTKEQTEEE